MDKETTELIEFLEQKQKEDGHNTLKYSMIRLKLLRLAESDSNFETYRKYIIMFNIVIIIFMILTTIADFINGFRVDAIAHSILTAIVVHYYIKLLKQMRKNKKLHNFLKT